MKVHLDLDHEAADALLVAVIKDSMRSIRKAHKNFNYNPEDEQYQKEYLAACKKVLHHFGH